MYKYLKTLKEIKQVADYYYGGGRYSILKFLYYSLFHVNTFYVYVKELNQPLLPPDPKIQDFLIITNLEELASRRNAKDLPREFYYDQMHNIDRFYLLVKNDEIAYIHWVYVKGDKSRFLRLNDFDAELNYNTTMPRFRGMGLMNHVMRYILLDLKEKGFKRVFGVVNKTNPPAIKNMEKSGFQKIDRIRAIGQINRKINL